MSDYQALFDKFLDIMLEKNSIPFALPYLTKVCEYLRIRKMEVVRYESLRHQAMGKSTILPVYDGGGECGEPRTYIHSEKTLIKACPSVMRANASTISRRTRCMALWS